jgi:hypothetical protein
MRRFGKRFGFNQVEKYRLPAIKLTPLILKFISNQTTGGQPVPGRFTDSGTILAAVKIQRAKKK